MSERPQYFTKDDMFVLGNVAAMAVMADFGELTLNTLNFLHDERPENAGSFLLYALFLQSRGLTREAIEMLENSPVFDAEINRDEAMALHLVLLQIDGQIERVMDLGYAYLDQNILASESAHHTVRTIIEQIEAAQAKAAHA